MCYYYAMIIEGIIQSVKPSIRIWIPSQTRWLDDCQLTKTAELSRWIPEAGQGVLAAISDSGVVYILARIEADPSENTESTISPLKEGVIMAPDGSTTIKRGSSLLTIFEKSMKLVAEKLQIVGDGILQDFKDAKDMAPQWMLTVKNKVMNSSVKVTPDTTEIKTSTLNTEAQVKAIIKSSLVRLGQNGNSTIVKGEAFETFWNAWMIYFKAHTHAAPGGATGNPVVTGTPPSTSPLKSTQVFID